MLSEKRLVSELREPKRLFRERIKPKDTKALAEDIKANGLRTRILINEKNTIIDGIARFRAIKLLGWEEVDVLVVSCANVSEQRSKRKDT